MKKILITFFTLISIVAAVYSIITSQWYFAAIPVGFLFGFFLQKGNLCAASAISESYMFKDRSKIWGFWVAIVTTMLSLSIIDYMGLITVNPKPLMWMSSIAGGLIFGSGMVLAGGCVSGVLYKSGTGNINSIMALMGVPFGVAAVESGPFTDFHLWMKSFTVSGSQGESITLFSLTGIPYILLAVLFVVATITYALLRKRKFNIAIPLKRSWKPWVAGIALGLLATVAYLTSDASGRNYPLGTTHGVYQYSLLMFNKSDDLKIITSKPEKPAQTTNIEKTTNDQRVGTPKKKVNLWLVILVLSLIAGSWTSGALSGQSKLTPRDPEQTLVALLGGLMIGAGAAFAGGCSIGNLMSGWGMMSIGNLIFGIVVIAANLVTTHFYLMGGSFKK